MTKEIEKIMNDAISLNACRKVLEIDSMEKAIFILLSPQGREFALRTGFPDVKTFRDNIEEVSKVDGVFVDQSGNILNHDCVAVGESHVEVWAEGAEKLIHVMAMHGAKVTLYANDYAVCTITEVNGGTVEIINDGTAVINIER